MLKILGTDGKLKKGAVASSIIGVERKPREDDWKHEPVEVQVVELGDPTGRIARVSDKSYHYWTEGEGSDDKGRQKCLGKKRVVKPGLRNRYFIVEPEGVDLNPGYSEENFRQAIRQKRRVSYGIDGGRAIKDMEEHYLQEHQMNPGKEPAMYVAEMGPFILLDQRDRDALMSALELWEFYRHRKATTRDAIQHGNPMLKKKSRDRNKKSRTRRGGRG